MNTAQNGKGGAPRPVDGERFRSGWEMIFSGKDLDRKIHTQNDSETLMDHDSAPDGDACQKP